MHSLMNKKTFYPVVALTLLAGIAIGQQSPIPTDTASKLQPSGVVTNANLTLSIAKSAEHTTLFRLLRASGLTDYSSGKGQYTVFAPTNQAFDTFTEDQLRELLLPSSKDRLAKLLAYHVVKGYLTTDQLSDGQTLTNVLGQILVIHKQEDRITIEDARGGVATVMQANIRTTNGVVYSIDQVLQAIPK